MQAQLGMAQTPPPVGSAQGPILAGTFEPIGSGDNLLAFRERVQELQDYYSDARTYLGRPWWCFEPLVLMQETQLITPLLPPPPALTLSRH